MVKRALYYIYAAFLGRYKILINPRPLRWSKDKISKKSFDMFSQRYHRSYMKILLRFLSTFVTSWEGHVKKKYVLADMCR